MPDTPADLQRAADEAAFDRRRSAPDDPHALPVLRPGERPRIARVSADEALEARRPGAGPPALQAVLAQEHVRRAAVALDQVAHRSDGALAQWGYVTADALAANEDDFQVVARLRAEMADALAVIEGMESMTRGRLSASPQPPRGPNLDPNPDRSDSPMDPKQYHDEATGRGPASPADAPPDSPHGGLGKGKQEAIENALAGDTGADGVLDHAPDVETTETATKATTKTETKPGPKAAPKGDDKPKK